MTTTPDPHQEPTAAQLIAIALGTSAPVPVEPVSPGDVDAAPTEATSTNAPVSPV